MIFLTLLTTLVLAQPPVKEEGWVDLFNGKNYAGFIFWIIAGPERSFDVKDGAMVFHPIPPGQTYSQDRVLHIDDQVHLSQFPITGFVYTRKQYANFDLKYEWKYERPTDLTEDSKFTGNSGAFIYLTRVLKSWPQSIEVEGKYTETGKLLAYGKAQVEAKDYPDARKAAMKPVGQWNETLVSCKDGEIKVILNGKLVAEGKTDQRQGAIGFQAQGACIYYRNIKVRELK